MRRVLLGVLILVATGLAVSMPSDALAQSAPLRGTALRDELLRDWRDMQATLRALAEAMPEAEYAFRPTPGQRTFGQQVVHVATANVLNLAFLRGGVMPPAIDRAATDKARAMATMDASFAYGAALLGAQSDATLAEVVQTNAFLGPSSRARVVYFLLGHSWDIYGQMVVYLRLRGGTPPASARP
ncbi:MAG: DinB family protein [Vicinamibacterales bacterium]